MVMTYMLSFPMMVGATLIHVEVAAFGYMENMFLIIK